MRLKQVIAVFALVGLAAGCGTASDSKDGSGKVDVRLGYFPNLTHAAAIVGVANGSLSDELGRKGKLVPQQFTAGPAAVEALFSDALDAAYIGPGPASNAFVRSEGEAVRIISGATAGGASLVVKSSISRPADLKGKKVASPQLGNTQDIALRTWLEGAGLKTTKEGGGDVQVVPQENAQILDGFRSGEVEAAWVPEPWASRLLTEGKGKVLIDEADLWPGRRFASTVLLVRTAFLEQHPGLVKRLVVAHVRTTDFLRTNPAADSQSLVNDQIAKVTKKPLSSNVIASAWENLEFTVDPVASSIRKMAAHAERLGFIPNSRIGGIFDLKILNEVLKQSNQPEISTR